MGNIFIRAGSLTFNIFETCMKKEEEQIRVPGRHQCDFDDGIDSTDAKERQKKNIAFMVDYLKPLVYLNFQGQASGRSTDSNRDGQSFHIGTYLKILDGLVRLQSDTTQFSCDGNSLFASLFKKIAEHRLGEHEESFQKLLADSRRFEKIYKDRAVNFPEKSLSDRMDHDEYWGTRQQLLSAKVICDWLCEEDQPPMDPIFGVLLNPTAGRVGKGDSGWLHNKLYDNTGAMAYHAAVHDAFGYLINFHGKGPGYNYMYRSFLDKKNCMAGQVSGIDFWKQHLKEIKPKLNDKENLKFV